MRPDWDSWFNVTTTAMWLEDFSAVLSLINRLKADGVEDMDIWLEGNPSEIFKFAALVRVFDANEAAVRLLQADSKESLLGDLLGAFDEDSRKPFARELVRIAKGERSFSVDVVSHTFKGERRYLRMSWTAAPGYEDNLEVVLVSATDITELVNMEAQLRVTLAAKDFMLREIEHRVRNTLALVNALLGMQASANPEAAPALSASARRVETIGLVHDSLYKSGDLSLAGLRDCIESVGRHAYASERQSTGPVSLSFDVEDCQIPLEAATPLALVTSELTVNALRHAYPGGRRGVITIQAKMAGADRLIVYIGDRGVGLPRAMDPKTSASLGFSLIRALAAQLGAAIEFSNGLGFSATLSLPIFQQARLPQDWQR